MTWDIDGIRRAFAVFDGFSGPSSDELWWRTDDEYAPITLIVNCNDLFVWACSDCETLTPENLPRLEATKAECLALGEDCGSEAALLWCARERGVRPQKAYYKHFPEIMHPLFDAVSDRPGYGHAPSPSTPSPQE
jgi:hypothetical protein